MRTGWLSPLPRTRILAPWCRVLSVWACLFLAATAPGCQQRSRPSLRLAATTSFRDSGLLDYLTPALEAEIGIRLEAIVVGSGQAIRLAEQGDADLLLVHAPAAEKEFVERGGGTERTELMRNDFVLLGPGSDPAGIRGSESILEAFRRLSRSSEVYLSRGDHSGTHAKEQEILAEAGVSASGDWYRESGQGQGTTLNIAAETGAYVLSDRATHAAHRHRKDLEVVLQGDPRLANPYSLILMNTERHPHVNAEAAKRALEWLTGRDGQEAIQRFQIDGETVFTPTARRP